MRHLVLGMAALVASSTASAQVYVHGYTTKNGTYVAPHYRSTPDNNPFNNWSARGNVNPYTGETGTKNPYSSYGSNGSYQSPYSSYPSQPNGSNSQSCTYSWSC